MDVKILSIRHINTSCVMDIKALALDTLTLVCVVLLVRVYASQTPPEQETNYRGTQ